MGRAQSLELRSTIRATNQQQSSAQSLTRKVVFALILYTKGTPSAISRSPLRELALTGGREAEGLTADVGESDAATSVPEGVDCPVREGEADTDEAATEGAVDMEVDGDMDCGDAAGGTGGPMLVGVVVADDKGDLVPDKDGERDGGIGCARARGARANATTSASDRMAACTGESATSIVAHTV